MTTEVKRAAVITHGKPETIGAALEQLQALAAEADVLEEGLGRAFAGDYVVVELPALEGEAAGERWPAVNDIVVTSSSLGRMIELGWAIGGEDLGALPCDGLICA